MVAALGLALALDLVQALLGAFDGIGDHAAVQLDLLLARAAGLAEAAALALSREMEADPNVVVLGEDVGRFGGVFRATAGLGWRF